MALSTNERVNKHREALRKAGLRPVQFWVPDTHRPDFANECRRQSLLIAKADARDRSLDDFLDAALDDLLGEAE